MNILNRDELQIIISFLSLQDRVNLRLSSKRFETLVKKQDIALHNMEKNVHRFFSLVMKPGAELILAVNNNFIMYVDESSVYRPSHIHHLFKIRKTNPKCINCNCREKRLGNIYISVNRCYLPKYLLTIYYIQRNIPYCIQCFNKWGVDAYLHHPPHQKIMKLLHPNLHYNHILL